MREEPPLSGSDLIRELKTHYGIEGCTLRFLALGADIHAWVYKLQTLDEKAYFIKLKAGQHHETAVEIAELLQNAGIRQMIPPVKTVDGRTTQWIEGFTLIVYPFVDGQDGFKRNLTDAQWTALGQALRQVHEIQVPLAIQKRIRMEAYSAKWREAVRTIYDRLAAAPIADEIALSLQQFMLKNMPVIHRLVDRAQQLGEDLQKQPPPCVLCHSDIHAGNVLIAENDAIYIVDWDEPIMAPKERDLMFIGGGVGNVWNLPHEEKQFYQGYGKTELNLTALAYYRHERIVEDIAIYSQQLLLKAEKDTYRPEMYKHFMDMFAPQGVVEIAFKTDKGLAH